MGQNSQELGRKYWATCSSVCSFARTTHSFACFKLLASLAPSAALTRSLAHFAHSLARGTVNDWMAILSVFFPIFDHSALKKTFKDKYASRLPESICCPNSVRPVLFRCDYASLSVRPSMFLSVRKRRKHSASNIRKRQTSFLTHVAISVLSGVFQQLSGHFPASHMGGVGRWTDRKTKAQNCSQS